MSWIFARLIAPVVTTTSAILSSNEIQNGDILVPADLGPPGEMAVETDRERAFESCVCNVGRNAAVAVSLVLEARIGSASHQFQPAV